MGAEYVQQQHLKAAFWQDRFLQECELMREWWYVCPSLQLDVVLDGIWWGVEAVIVQRCLEVSNISSELVFLWHLV